MWYHHLSHMLYEMDPVSSPSPFVSVLLHPSDVRPPPLVESLVQSLLVTCVRGCGKVVRIGQYQQHLQGACQTNYYQLTISEILSRPSTSPVTPVEVEATGHLVKKMMDQSRGDSKGMLTIPRRGHLSNTIRKTNTSQPLTLVQVSKSRVTSAKASRWTLRRRTKDIGRVRSISSRGESSAQLAAEVRALSREEREKLLLDAKLPIHIPADYALALKADLSIPWNKLRSLRR